MAFIEVDELRKTYRLNVRHKGLIGAFRSLLMPEYRTKEAVNGIHFSIEKGEAVGFIGPNGAGKSTTVKMLTGILTPTSGTVAIGGLDPYKDRKKNAGRIGVVFGQRSQLWWDLPVIDTFDLLRYVYKIPEKVYRRNVDAFCELLDMGDYLHQAVRQLSLGQRMKADIAASMLHEPEALFFDEPTIGLDVVAKEKIREFIRYVNKEKGTTLLLTTHDMVDIEKTCDRMIIIDHGRKIYDGTVDEIKAMYGKERIMVVEFGEQYGAVQIPGVELIREADHRKWFKFDKDDIQVPALMNKLAHKLEVLDITVQEPEIDLIIRQIYQGGIELHESLSGVC